MTREEILEMKPGLELDALAAEKVMRWRVESFDVGMEIVKLACWDGVWRKIPEFSSNISEAWPVLEHFYKRGDKVTLTNTIGGNWKCYISTGTGQYDAIGETAPEAICKAALLAVMNK